MTEISIHGWIALAIIIVSVTAMIRSSKTLPTYLVFLVGSILLVLTGCIDIKTALQGFGSNTIALLFGVFVVVAGLENTGVLNVIATKMLKRPKSFSGAIVRLMTPVSILSAFILNVAVVALFTGVVKNWAKQLNIPASKLLLPLLYATKSGGLLLTIGVSSNLLVIGQYEDATGKTLGVTFPFLAGLFCVVVCIISIVALQKLLPVRKCPEEEFVTNDAVTELKIPAGNPYIGQTIGECPVVSSFLDNSSDIELLGIIRFDGKVVRNVTDDEFLMGGDTLLLTGPKKEILSLGKSLRMKSNIMDQQPSAEDRRRMPIALAILLLNILLPMITSISWALSFLMAAVLMIVTGCIKPENVLRSMNANIILIIGCCVAYGNAIEMTGLAQLMADNIASWCGSSPLLALTIICSVSVVLSDVLSGYISPVLLTPIAIHLSSAMGVNPLTFVLGLLISCSCCFATPLGDGSKILTYVSGGYRFTDFLKIGIPMNIIMLIANIFITILLYPFP